MVCVGLVFGRKNVQYHISINTTEVDSHSDSLHYGNNKTLEYSNTKTGYIGE